MMKKKWLVLFLVLVLAAVLGACGRTGASDSSSSAAAVSSEEAGPAGGLAGKKILIAYFSRADENTGGVGYIEKGNTRIVAEEIAAETGGDLFEIHPVKPYPKEYKPATEVAKQEKEEQARPEIDGPLPDLSQYDVIFLGYPIWWRDMPMAVYTFLEQENFKGKLVIPFCTHEGSGISDTPAAIAKTTGATVGKGFELRGHIAQQDPDQMKKEVSSWLRNMK